MAPVDHHSWPSAECLWAGAHLPLA
jgi:hypothetical protein